MFNTYTSDGLVYVCVTIQEITYESRSRMFVTCESVCDTIHDLDRLQLSTLFK